MKRKLSSAILAIALMFSMSLPAFAADCQTQSGDAGTYDLLWMLLRCGGCQNGTQLDWETLLRDWLGLDAAPSGAPAQDETQQDAPTETPTQSEAQPAEPEEPARDETPQEQPAEPEEPTQPVSVSAYEREVARLVNIERAKAGLAPLTLDAELSRVARMKSQDMHDGGYFDHNSPTYGTPFQLMKSQGIRYRTAGENIAMGYRTPEAVVNAWMNSEGHRANILNASYTTIGVGYVADGSYWTQHFIG